MNRDIVSVLLGGFGTKATAGGEAMAIEGEATMTTASDVATALTEANSVRQRHFRGREIDSEKAKRERERGRERMGEA